MANLHRRVQELRRDPPAQRRARPVVGEQTSSDRAHRPRISSGLAQISNAQEDRDDPPADAAHEAQPAATNMNTGTGSPSTVRPPSHPNVRSGTSWLGPQPVPWGPGSPPSPEKPPMVINPSIWKPPGITHAANPFPGNPNVHRPPPPPPPPPPPSPVQRRGAVAHHHHPFAQLPTLPPHERGHWAFDTATWPAATRTAFATAVGAPGTYCDRYWDRRSTQAGDQPLAVQRRGTKFRILTTRVLSGPVWRRLIADSHGWLETVRAVWVDGNGRQVTLMVPRRGGIDNDGGWGIKR